MADELQISLTETQRRAIQAMAADGMPVADIADALMIPADLIEGHSVEWRVSRIEALRIGQIEAELLPPKVEYKGAARKRAFLRAYIANGGNATDAAAAAGFERTQHYRWLKDDPEYQAAFELAKEQAADTLEDVAVRRAKTGVLEPMFNKAGELIGHKLRYSDQLLLSRLAADRPERWRSRVSAEVTGRDGGPIETKSVLPGWLLERLKSESPTGSTTPSPVNNDSTRT